MNWKDVLPYISMGLIIGILAGGVYLATQDTGESRMPSDFNYTQSLEVVDRTVPGTCESLENNTEEDRYVFECAQPARQGNYSLTAYGAVEYNQSGGNHKVIVFDKN